MLSDVFASHFKSNQFNFFQVGAKKQFHSAIVGSALCVFFANEKHKLALESINLLSQYQTLGEKIYSVHDSTIASIVHDDISEMDIGLPTGALFDTGKDGFYLKIAISSHVSTKQKTLPILLKSLAEAQIDEADILIVIGGSPKEYIERKHGILHSYVTHNSYDHNALIDIVEKDWGGDWWWIMHDTIKVGPKFKDKVLAFGAKANYISALRYGWLNMGLFSRKAINDMRGYILQLKNCNKMQAILSEKLYPRMSDSLYYDIVEKIDFPYLGDVYGDGVERQVMYMPSN